MKKSGLINLDVKSISQILKPYRTIAEYSPDIIFEIDHSITCRFANSLAREFFHLKGKRIKNRLLKELLNINNEDVWLNKITECIKNNEKIIFDHHFTTNEGEKFFETVLIPIKLNGNQNGNSKESVSVLSVSRDITEREKVRLELIKQQELLKNLLSVLPVGVWIADENGSIIGTNKAGEEIWQGARYVPINDLSVYKAWWANTGKILENEDWAIYRAMKKGETSLNEILDIECFDGTKKTIINSAVPLTLNNKLTGVAVVNQDITHLREVEKQLRKLLEEKEFLFKEANHRIKNNLQIIDSLLNLSAGNITDESAKDAIYESQARIRTVSAVHESLYRSYSLNEIYLQKFIFSIVDYLQKSLVDKQSKNVRIIKDIEDGLVKANVALALGLIINELVTNSIKHAFSGPDGIIIVEMKILNNNINLNIKDDGKGMDPALLQSDSGFGLQLVKTLVEQHSGEMHLNFAGGTVFNIILQQS